MVIFLLENPTRITIWMFPKIVGFPPKSSILIGFSIIFTIHFGVPLFLETPVFSQTKAMGLIKSRFQTTEDWICKTVGVKYQTCVFGRLLGCPWKWSVHDLVSNLGYFTYLGDL